MKKILQILLLALLAGCGSEAKTDIPKVSSDYKKNMDAAWSVADEGKSPTIACAQVIGTAAATVKYANGNKPEAAQAYEACYVDAFAKYAKVFMAQPEQAEKVNDKWSMGCLKLASSYRIHSMAFDDSAKDLDLDINVLVQRLRKELGNVAESCPDLAQDD